MKLKHKCVKCGKSQVYKTKEGFRRRSGFCQSCAARQRTAREGKTPHKGIEVPSRTCPSCGKKLCYSSWNAFWSCEAKNTQCAHCAAIHRPDVFKLEQTVVELYHEGVSDKNIAVRVGKHEATVKRILHKHKLSTTRRSDALRLQPKIDKYLSLNGNLYRRINRHCTMIKNRAKNGNVAFDLTTEYLMDLFQHQGGLCFYSDQPISVEVGKGYRWRQLSIDRIIPEIGYIRGNVVWCTRRVNTIKNNVTLEEMKEWMPGWYARIQTFLGKAVSA